MEELALHRYIDDLESWERPRSMLRVSWALCHWDRQKPYLCRPPKSLGIGLNELPILEKTTVTPHGIPKSAVQGPNSGNSSKEFNSGSIIR